MESITETAFREAYRSYSAVRAQALALRRQALALGEEVRRTQAALIDAVEASRRTLRSAQAARDARMEVAGSEPAVPQSALVRAMAAVGLNAEIDLDDLTDDLLAAYADAVAQDDDLLIALFGGALREIGRHLVARLGPRAAGALSS